MYVETFRNSMHKPYVLCFEFQNEDNKVIETGKLFEISAICKTLCKLTFRNVIRMTSMFSNSRKQMFSPMFSFQNCLISSTVWKIYVSQTWRRALSIIKQSPTTPWNAVAPKRSIFPSVCSVCSGTQFRVESTSEIGGKISTYLFKIWPSLG